MFKTKTTDDSSILKFGAVLCVLLFLGAGNEIAKDNFNLGAVVVGFGVFSSCLLVWLSGKM